MPSKRINKRWLAHELRRRKKSFENLATHNAQLNINLEKLRPYLLPVPPLSEQEAIAEALSDADALIESLEQLIAKKDHIKQGAMQELLRPKDGWIATKLGRLGAFLKGSGIRKDEALSGDLPCVRYGEIYTKHSDYIKAFYSWISPTVAATARRLKCGDVLFAGSGETKDEIGKCVAFVDDIEAYAGGDIVILRPEKENPMFLGYYLNTAPINRQKASKGQGDAVVHLSSAALADIDLTLPPSEEQTAIAAILSDMDTEIAALEEKLAKARQLKHGMMQELLTGKIRLVESAKWKMESEK
jgi:type I restriction enzyme S subunit